MKLLTIAALSLGVFFTQTQNLSAETTQNQCTALTPDEVSDLLTNNKKTITKNGVNWNVAVLAPGEICANGACDSKNIVIGKTTFSDGKCSQEITILGKNAQIHIQS